MNLFKGLIFCKNCGKKYNGKQERNSYNYICSGYKNKGAEYCQRRILHQEDIMSVIKLHCSKDVITEDTIKEIVDRIEVSGDLITIYYNDGSKSSWNNSLLSI